MKRAHLFISGQVQGVFFRAYTQAKAQKLGLAGWVRNTSDDQVEAVFEGPEERLKEMIAWCHQGSPASQVEKAEISWEEAENLQGFEIKYG